MDQRDPYDDDLIRRIVERTRKQQGLPESIDDVAVLAYIAGLLERDAGDVDWSDVRHQQQAHRRAAEASEKSEDA